MDCAGARARTRVAARAAAGAVGLLAATTTAAPAQLAAPARVHVAVADAADPRVALVHRAIAHWNQTFYDLGLQPAFGDVSVLVAPPELRTLETFARVVAVRAGRLSHGGLEPPSPPALSAVGGEVVVLLSSQRLMPFAWPLPETAAARHKRYLVAIRAADAPAGDGAPGTADASLRTVVAHELGHALGLRHTRNATTLMCMPCQADAGDPGATYPPLAERDRARLHALYQRREAAPAALVPVQ